MLSTLVNKIKLTIWVSFKSWLAGFAAIGIAIWVSVIIHALILSVRFEPALKKIADKLPSLEMVLVNNKTKTAPEKADLLAQNNLDRGGNTEQNKQLKTALPAPLEKTTELKLKPSTQLSSAARSAKLKEQEVREQKRVDELEKQAQELMTQINATKTLTSNPAQNAAAIEPDLGEQQIQTKALNRADLIAASLEMNKLEAQIDKQQEEYQKRPKRKFIGARTKEYRFAMYVEAWRQKVERIGNMNYPEAFKAEKLYGQLRMTVSIKADGSLEKVVIDQASKYKMLDDAAKRIVQLAAPYAVFPDDIKKDTDILDITRTWIFTQDDSLETK